MVFPVSVETGNSNEFDIWKQSYFSPVSPVPLSVYTLAPYHSRPQSRLVLLAAGGWARGRRPSRLRGTGGSGDKNGSIRIRSQTNTKIRLFCEKTCVLSTHHQIKVVKKETCLGATSVNFTSQGPRKALQDWGK